MRVKLRREDFRRRRRRGKDKNMRLDSSTTLTLSIEMRFSPPLVGVVRSQAKVAQA